MHDRRTDPSPSSLSAETRAHHDFFDVAVGNLVGLARLGGHSIPCKRGCDACCYDVTDVVHFEIAPLIEYLRTMPAAVLDEIERRISEWQKAMVSAGLDPTQPEPDLRRYIRMHVPCPLLDLEHHECRVYDVRPFTCRGHYLMNAPAAVCANRAKEPTVPVLYVGEVLLPTMQSLAQHYGDGRKMITIGRSTLPQMLAEAWPLVRDPSLSITEWMAAVERSGKAEWELSEEEQRP